MRTSCARGGGPAFFRSDAVVAEERDANVAPVDIAGPRCAREIRTRAAVRDSCGVERVDGVGDSFGTAVGDVIARKRDCTKPGAAYRRDVVGIRSRRRDVAMHLRRMARVRDFDVPNRYVRTAHCRRDSVEPIVRLRNIEDEITGEEQVEVAHEPWRQLVRSINYSYYYHQSPAAVESGET